MTKRQSRQAGEKAKPDLSSNSVRESDEIQSNSFAWSPWKRQVVSIVILVYLGILLLGPLSDPIASTHFSGPLARTVSPVHRILFQGHGYRFFGPDPAASHLLVYRGVRADGSEFSGHFPDRDSISPRLMYHRWFMLSETIFTTQLLNPSKEQVRLRNLEYEQEIENLTRSVQLDLKKRLVREQEIENAMFENVNQRMTMLASSIGRVLMDRNDGETIELFVQERAIPFPEQVAEGMQLKDEAFLSELVKIGEMDSQGFRISPKVIEPQNLPGPSEGDSQ